MAFIGIDLSLWDSWESRFECQPGSAVGPRTRLTGRQGWSWRFTKHKVSPGQSLCMKHQKSNYPPDTIGKNHVGYLPLEFAHKAQNTTNISIVNTYPPGRGWHNKRKCPSPPGKARQQTVAGAKKGIRGSNWWLWRRPYIYIFLFFSFFLSPLNPQG